jgi:DNA-binding response OmpR family regulator
MGVITAGPLVRHPGHVKTRQQLLAEACPHDASVSDRTIDSHVKRLRKKIAAAAPGALGIETVYGLGYRFRHERLPSPAPVA